MCSMNRIRVSRASTTRCGERILTTTCSRSASRISVTQPLRIHCRKGCLSIVNGFGRCCRRSSMLMAAAGDDKTVPEDDADFDKLFEDQAEDAQKEVTSKKAPEAESPDRHTFVDEETTSKSGSGAGNESEDITSKDRLAYERLIIEGADVEDAESEMKVMDATISTIQESYLDGSAYDSRPDPPQMPIKKLEDFPYPPMPEFSMQLTDLLEQTELKSHVQTVRERWGDVEVTGMQSYAENVKSGDLYFARKTEEYDGFSRIPLAFDNGAVAIIIEREDKRMHVNGVSDVVKTRETNNKNEPEGDADNMRKDLGERTSEDSIPIDTLADLMPVLPVDNIRDCMGELGYYFYSDARICDITCWMLCILLGRPSSNMKVVGIVGSHGKTSTAWILQEIFMEYDVCTGMMSDIEYSIQTDQLTEEGDLFIPEENDPAHFRLAATPYHHTLFKGRYYIKDAIPDPLQVQKVLSGMMSRGVEVCVIECPTYAFCEECLVYVDFDVLVYTNLQAERTDTAVNFQERKSINSFYFSRMHAPERQRAIINIDDPHAQDFITESSAVPVVTYSMDNPEADVLAEKVLYSIWESELVVRTPIGKLQIITPLIGPNHVYNILASVATAVSLDVDLQTIVTGIESLDFVPGRYEVVDKGQVFSIVVDRANTAKRLTALVKNIKLCGARKIYLVFGCTHEHSIEERAEMGAAAFYDADVVIITSDSPGMDAPSQVIDDVVAGFPEDVLKRSALWVNSPWQDPGRVPWWFEPWLFKAQSETGRHVVEDRSLAIRGAIGTAVKGDVVVIAGRGDRDYSWWADKDDQPLKTWYEDRREVRDALTKLPHLRKSQVVTDRLPWTESRSVSGKGQTGRRKGSQ